MNENNLDIPVTTLAGLTSISDCKHKLVYKSDCELIK